MSQNNNARNNDENLDIEVESRLLENDLTNTQTEANEIKDRKKINKELTLSEEVDEMMKDLPITEDISCGFWFLRGAFFQKFANQTAYVIIYGLVGCIFSMTDHYLNGTITTIEKRFKIPSKNTGIIIVGYDISQVLVSVVISYYGGKGHRPRWIGFGLLTLVTYCLLTAAPQLFYGPGSDALALTKEFGTRPDENVTKEVIEEQRSKTLCKLYGDAVECEEDEGYLIPQVMFFTAHFISGIGGTIYATLGISYMDDNTKKTKTPILLSLAYFLRMLGPAIGYALASFCLRFYIAPRLHPTITDNDPRWLGAWWLGWLILAGMLFLSGIFLTMFPKQLPRAAARRMVETERERRRKLLAIKQSNNMEIEKSSTEMNDPSVMESKASLKDLKETLKRLVTNKILMYNNFSSVFYFFGYTPYWIFTPKYIEMQYRQSAAQSNLVTGTVALIFSAIGVLLSGFVISKYKPSARYMAAWNVIVGFLTVLGILSYYFIGCPGNDKSVIVNIYDSSITSTSTCNSACHCDYVRYSPVCGENNMTYISPCHAGCKKQHENKNGDKMFYDCACIPRGNYSTSATFERLTAIDMAATDFDLHLKSNELHNRSKLDSKTSHHEALGGQAIPDSCPVDCFAQFVYFLAVMCFLKFIGASGRASNFLVSVRCVAEKDKTASMGFHMMIMSFLAFMPSPIFFGWLFDSFCLVWGKTCTNNGNCWLYDAEKLRYTLNITSSMIILIGALFDCGVWYYVKDLKIFDEEGKQTEMECMPLKKKVNSTKNTELMQ